TQWSVTTIVPSSRRRAGSASANRLRNNARRCAEGWSASPPGSCPRPGAPRTQARSRSDVEEIAPRLWWWTASHPQWTPEDLEGGEGWEQIVSSYALAAGGAFVSLSPPVGAWQLL